MVKFGYVRFWEMEEIPVFWHRRKRKRKNK
jgi:hypothetical protein